MKSFPPDVVVFDTDGFIHARLASGSKNPRLVNVKAYRLAPGTFEDAPVTPELKNEASLTEALRRLRADSGRWEKVSVLLPDSWFRMNILDVPSLPDRSNEALEIVRWTLRRTLPIPAESLRIAWDVLSRSAPAAKLLVVSAVEATLVAIERAFAASGMEVILIESTGLNIWNAIATRQTTVADRVFFYIREDEFTTAVFRGSQPLFLRSRNLRGDRAIDQEIRLSATYLRDSLGTTSFESCFVAGGAGRADLQAIVAAEFNAPVHLVSLREFAEDIPADSARFEAELAACTGVFTA